MKGQVVREEELWSLFSPLGALGRIRGCEFDEGDGFDPASTRNRPPHVSAWNLFRQGQSIRIVPMPIRTKNAAFTLDHLSSMKPSFLYVDLDICPLKHMFNA